MNNNELSMWAVVCPIFKIDDMPMKSGWYFYDETWADSHGPYETFAEVTTELSKYCQHIIGECYET